MRKWQAILLIYLGSCCYTMASFYHLSLGERWTFWRAYLLALAFVLIEYVLNILGNKHANQHITVFQIMLLIIAFDLVNLFILNALVLKSRIHVVRDGISLMLICAAIAISSDVFGSVTPVSGAAL